MFGVPIARLLSDEALEAIGELLDSESPSLVAYANAHTLNLAWSDVTYCEILKGADLALNDGSGVALAARMRGVRFPENLNGSDLNPKIIQLAAARGARVFLLGGAGGVAERAADRLARMAPGLKLVGTRDGYFPDAQSEEIVASIRATAADLLLVAMGNPRQENWLAEHLAETGCRVGIGVGAFFDFTAGTQRRAPAWMNRLGVEWIFRLMREPSRMWRRYVLGNPLFLIRAWRTRTENSGSMG